MRHTLRIAAMAAVSAVGLSAPAQAQLINLGPGSFTPLASTITFSEYAVGTVNPSYNFVAVPGLGNVTVSFAGAFMGQTVSGFPATLSGSPTGPLALNNSVVTRIVNDGANPTTPVLSGDPTFNGPVSVFFSQSVAAVGLDGGFFDAIGGTSITAFDSNGNNLGSITNSQTGIEFFGLATASGNNTIRGISFYITGNEPAGFAIDNLTFGAREVLVDPPGTVTPEPVTMTLLGTGLAGVAAARRRRKAADA